MVRVTPQSLLFAVWVLSPTALCGTVQYWIRAYADGSRIVTFVAERTTTLNARQCGQVVGGMVHRSNGRFMARWNGQDVTVTNADPIPHGNMGDVNDMADAMQAVVSRCIR